MRTAALLGPYHPESTLAWDHGSPITCRRFLSDVVALADRLPDKSTVINLAEDRYRFFVGFAAALVRGHTTLLLPGRAPNALTCIAKDYGDTYCLTDGQETRGELPVCPLSVGASRIETRDIPRIPTDQTAAIAFTSGSTGLPSPNPKSWGSLVAVAQHTGDRLGLKPTEPLTVVATVPHQHMFGLEACLMLPTQFGLPFHTGRPFYPEDIRSALATVPPRRFLATTPLHIRACVTAQIGFPEVDMILSATAPLSVEMARQAETLFQTQVHEVYGFTEVGSLATRRTVAGPTWQALEGISLIQESDGCSVHADYLPKPMAFPDVVTLDGPQRFVLHGRGADLVNIAGHRISLNELNQKLNEIDGVHDGVFVLPDEAGTGTMRLMAFVVAPGKSVADIMRALRAAIDPVFLPRPLSLVPSLLRNETGKLTNAALLELIGQMQGQERHGE